MRILTLCGLAVLLAFMVHVTPARSGTEADVRRIYAECSYWDAEAYPRGPALWAQRIERGEWSLYELAQWGLSNVIRQRAGQLRATMPNGKPDRAARRAAGREIKRMHDLCNVRQYRGR